MGWTFYNSSGEALIEDGAAVAATQAQMEAASSTDDSVFVTPGRTHNHPGVAKVWAKWEQNGGDHDMAVEYGVNTMADGGAAGFSDMTFDTNFSSTAYSVTGSVEAAMIFMTEAASWAAGAITIRSSDTAGTYTDATHLCVAIFGDH